MTKVGLFKDVDGSLSSRILAMAIVLIFDLIIVVISMFLQKDLPNNVSNILLTLSISTIPTCGCLQVYQNIKDKEKEIHKDLDGDGKIGE